MDFKEVLKAIRDAEQELKAIMMFEPTTTKIKTNYIWIDEFLTTRKWNLRNCQKFVQNQKTY